MDCNKQITMRVQWIKQVLKNTGCTGVVLGNSGGKDSALVAMLCKMATDNVLGVLMPCESKRNYGEDTDSALELAQAIKMKSITVDLTPAKQALRQALSGQVKDELPFTNINPRLRMITLYAIAQQNNCLVAGTGNLSERTMGYFTKHGDGGCDFNPIGDLTVSEVYQLLDYLNAPKSITQKPPSAGLWDGQTDEGDMGVSYNDIDNYLKGGSVLDSARQKIQSAYNKTHHKRSMPLIFNQAEFDKSNK